MNYLLIFLYEIIIYIEYILIKCDIKISNIFFIFFLVNSSISEVNLIPMMEI